MGAEVPCPAATDEQLPFPRPDDAFGGHRLANYPYDPG
jgi:hypothetical protein